MRQEQAQNPIAITVEDAIQIARQHHDAGRSTQAEEIYRQILAQRPDHAQSLHLLGMLAGQTGRMDMAIELIRRAIAICSTNAACHSDLGNALREAGQLDASIASCRQAIQLKPDYAIAHNNLANALRDVGQLDAAIASYRQAIRFKPDFGVAHNNLSFALQSAGQLDEAIAVCRQILQLKPGLADVHSSLLCTLQFHPGYDARMVYEEHRLWNAQHAEPLKKFIGPHTNNRDPSRRLRIGYVSADFREHVVGWNLLPLLREHDRQQVEIFCYAGVARPDALTGQLQRHADVWRSILDVPDAQAADLIRQDRIDILVDLSIHTAKNRLLVFARKPAPVQVTYLGYCASTGMEATDYRLSDPYMDPPDSDLSIYSEQTIRLPETYWCYQPGGPTPDVSPLPALAAGNITFGCLNNFVKVSAPAMDLWAEILRQVHRSRLIIHSAPGVGLDAVKKRFADHGVSSDRLEFVSSQPWKQYIHTYNRIDISLDPFPWGGGITTCDAIWMGVPVVSLVGSTAVGRGGSSILANLKLPELAACLPQQYVQIAVDLVNDPLRLAELRRTLRGRMQASPLMDAPLFARNIESAYRQMWHTWCQTHANS